MAWEDVKHILRPEGVVQGVMKADPEKCTKCGLCIENCPLRCWDEDDDGVPVMREGAECFSCYNCMAACEFDAMHIVEPYHVTEGFWQTKPDGKLPAKMPLEPFDAEGKPDEWNTIEEAVLNRRSVRNFKKDPIPEPLIRRVLEAGRFAPSAGNCQPWQFVVVTNPDFMTEMYKNIANMVSGMYNMYTNDNMVKTMESFVKGPQARVGMFDPRIMLGGMGVLNRFKDDLAIMVEAPCMIVIACDDRAIGDPMMHAGIAGQNMNLVANSLGIKALWVGFTAMLEMMPPLKKKLGIRPPFKVLSSLVLGYPRFKQEGMVAREFRPIGWLREGKDELEIED